MAGLNDLVNIVAVNALEEAEILANHGRQFHQYDDPFEDTSELKFVKLYRLSKPMVSDLIDLLEPHLVVPSRVSALSNSRKVLTALRFFASGSYQLDVGSNINHAMSQASVSKAIHEVTDALNLPEILNNYVRLPRNIQELRTVREMFYQRHRFPGIIGCVDCTHVAIYPPKVNDGLYPEAAYVNRKGYHSINVQLICDTNLKIINACARYPGSPHDNYIWNNSNAFQYIRNLHNNGQRSFCLLGDSGYALRPWMLTPITNALPNTPEDRYNSQHTCTRSLIERCNGVLKLRFRCLLKHRVLHYAPDRASKIINSCVVLHNMCIDNNLPPVELENEDRHINIDYGMYDIENVEHEPHVGVNRVDLDLAAGRRIQRLIIQNNFLRR